MQVKMYGVTYPTIEHAYQAAKTEDIGVRERILLADKPGQAKRLARKLIKPAEQITATMCAAGIVPLREDWDEFRLTAMMILLDRKFANPVLRGLLVATGDAKLIEGNSWGDEFWGCTMHETRWHGQNHLGRFLMQIRERIVENAS